MITSQQINYVFYTLSTIAITYKFTKWLKASTSSSKRFSLIQLKYFIVFYMFNGALALQGPYVFPLYRAAGLSPKDISTLQIIFNISNSFFGFFAGSVLQKLGTKLSIVYAIISSFILGILRYIGQWKFFVLAQLICGFSAPIKAISFEAWILHEIEQESNSKACQLSFSENNALINLLVNIAVAPFGNFLASKFEPKFIFLGTACFILLDALCGLFLISTYKGNDNKPNENKQNGSVFSAIQTFLNSASFSSITFALVDVLYCLFPLLFVPRISGTFTLDSVKYPLASIHCSHNVCQLFGAILATFLCSFLSSNIALPFILLLMACAQLTVFLKYDDKTYCYIALCFIGLSDGCISSLLLGLRKELYKEDIRVRIMGVIRFMSAVIASLVLSRYKSHPNYIILGISGVSVVLAFICSIFFALSYKQPEKVKRD